MYQKFTFLVITLIISFSLWACSSDSSDQTVPENLTEAVLLFHSQNKFDKAFDLLREADENEPALQDLVFATHMNYALYLTYEAETVAMTERMPTALRHFRRVLELDPGNQRVQAEIALIEGIYRQMGRDIPEGVASL